MALVSLSRCSSEARSSGGAFAFAMSGAILSFLEGCIAEAGVAGTFALAFGSSGVVLPAVLPVGAAVDSVSDPLAGSAAMISAFAATVGGGKLGNGGCWTAGGIASAAACGGLLW